MIESRIFLVGFMGSGKSTVGKSLALAMNWNFIDLDQYIERAEGITITTIFSELGEQKFREIEKKALEEVALLENVIVATGGGTPCFDDNMKLMNSRGITIYLELSPMNLRDRIMPSRETRPLVAGKSSEELLSFIKTKLPAREHYYRQAAITIDATRCGTKPYLDAIKAFLARPYPGTHPG